MENENQSSNTLGIIALVSVGLSFFAGMFVFQIIGLLLAGFSPKKNELHIIAIVLGVISLLIDLSTLYAIASYY